MKTIGVRLRPASLALIIALGLGLGGCDSRPFSGHGERATSPAEPAVRRTGRVTDAANILPLDQARRIASKLASLEQSTGHQLVVVTVPTLGGQEVSTFTRNLANSWGVGRAGYNDGVVLLVAPNERRVRIEVGSGLEKVLPNELCSEIISNRMMPRFRTGELDQGVEAGVDALTAALR